MPDRKVNAMGSDYHWPLPELPSPRSPLWLMFLTDLGIAAIGVIIGLAIAL